MCRCVRGGVECDVTTPCVQRSVVERVRAGGEASVAWSSERGSCSDVAPTLLWLPSQRGPSAGEHCRWVCTTVQYTVLHYRPARSNIETPDVSQELDIHPQGHPLSSSEAHSTTVTASASWPGHARS